MSQEILELNTKAIQILEERGFVYDGSICIDTVTRFYFCKSVKCGIKYCDVPIKMSLAITNSEEAKAYDCFDFEFELNHHENRRGYGKVIAFNTPKIVQKKKKGILLEVFQKAIDYVQDNMDKFGDFVDENKEDEFYKYKWFLITDDLKENPLCYCSFFISPRFIEDEIVFKTCEIDDNLLGTEARLKVQPGYMNLVLRRF